MALSEKDMAIDMGDCKRKKCACCGKEFYITYAGWAYKRAKAGKSTKYYCSWSCFRKDE